MTEVTRSAIPDSAAPSVARRIAPTVAEVCALLDRYRVQALVLREWDALESGDGAGPRTRGSNQVLVQRADAKVARGALDALDWRYAWHVSGPLRLASRETCWWDEGSDLDLLWGIPALPLPSGWLEPVARALWDGAAPGPDGRLQPEPAALLVHLAVQACRPGWQRRLDWVQLRALLARFGDMALAERLARAAGVSTALRRSLAAADAGREAPGPGDVYDGARNAAWRLALAVQARARPRRWRRILAGSPALGDAGVRVRVAGLELIADPGVFVPPAPAEQLVSSSSAALDEAPRGVVVEVGTGCGPIALALARGHPEAEIHAIDLERNAISSARRNARRLGISGVHFYAGSLLAPLPSRLRGAVDLVLANLPYIPPSDELSIGSLSGTTILGIGADGLGLQRALAREALPYLRAGSRLMLQMLATQWPIISPELERLGYLPQEPDRFGAYLIAPYRWSGGAQPAAAEAAVV